MNKVHALQGRKITLNYLVLLASLLLPACHKQSVDELLSEADRYLYTNIDSTALILEKISNPEVLQGKQQADYNRLKGWCEGYLNTHWKQADSLSYLAINYYRNAGDTTLLMQELFFSGRANLFLKQPDSTINRLMEFRTLNALIPDKKSEIFIDYSIANAYLQKEDREKALHFSKKGLLQELGNQDKYNYLYQAASIHSQLNQTDSAIVYYRKILEIPNLQERTYSQISNEIAQILLDQGNYKEALIHTEESIQNRFSRKDIGLFNLTKGEVFLALNQLDSARIYLQRAAESSENQLVPIRAYALLAELYKITGDFQQAYFKRSNSNDLWENSYSSIDASFLNQKYQEEKLKNENNELKLAKKQREIYLLTGALVFIIVSLILIALFMKEQKKKRIREQTQREVLLKNQARLAEHENLLLKQENELSRLREKEAVMRESLFRKMSLSVKIPSLERNKNSAKEPNKKINLDESEWEELIQTVNDAYDGFVSRLKESYPDLSTEDIAFCCLLKINISLQDLSDIYCISKTSITKRKTRMKKERFNLQEESDSLDEFLSKF